MIEKVNYPNDLKKLSIDELNILCDEIRNILISKINITGGHLGSNLGIVEATVALHYVFDMPKDKIVFDVSHQSYTHKILTGRKEYFMNPEKFGKISGYTTPDESEYDLFKVGHTSTSVSLACGLAVGRNLLNEKENVVVVIGDGSLSGGEAFEGLDNAALLNSNFIVIFNDNEMSIPENVGGIYKNFAELRESKGLCENNIFKCMGFDYRYIEEGNDVEKLIEAFKDVKDIDHPIIVHIHTLKGKGSEFAEKNKELGHYFIPRPINRAGSIEEFTSNFMLEKINANVPIMCISSATPLALGLDHEFRRKAGKNYMDVGICEEHAVAFASGIAKNATKPYYFVNSNFLQRCYDQLLQDLSLNNNPATILVFRGQVSGGDATHVGQYDIAYTGSIPNLVCVAPYYFEDYEAILNYSLLNKEHSLLIRVPAKLVHSNKQISYSKKSDFKYKIVENGRDICLIGLGNSLKLCLETAKLLNEKGINPTIVDPLIYSTLDKNTLDFIKQNHKVVVTVEDGIVRGGWGESIASYLGAYPIKVVNYGGEKDFNDLLPTDQLLRKLHLTPELLADDIVNLLK